MVDVTGYMLVVIALLILYIMYRAVRLSGSRSRRPFCDRCGGAGRRLARQAIDRSEDTFPYACKQGHVFHVYRNGELLEHSVGVK